jgi:mono/diheme cytochrome c family protein
LHQSVPAAAKIAANPLGADPADVSAGRDLYRQKCEVCHAYDGSGETVLAPGQYPRPPALRSAADAATSDGEIFYHIRKGIRNTAMPAWNLPDRETGQLVSYIRDLPKVAQLTPVAANVMTGSSQTQSHYVGSPSCKNCHQSVYAAWSKTRMANVVRDPRQHPDAIIPDFSKPDPMLTFTKNDIALGYGSRWKQRYFKRVGDDYFVYPAQWDVAHQLWRPYFVANGADWWAPLYPPDNFQRPTAPLCDGCHSVNFDIATKNPDRVERRLREMSRSR